MEKEENMEVTDAPEIAMEKTVVLSDADPKSSLATLPEDEEVKIVRDVLVGIVNRVSDETDDEVTIIGERSNEIICIEDDVNEESNTDAQTPRKTGTPTPCRVQVFTTSRLVPYRDCDDDATSDTDSDSETTSSADSEESSSSSDSDDLVVQDENPGEKRKSATTAKQPQRSVGIKTPGELDITDLPPIQDLHITLPKEELHPVGKVYNMVDQLLVIESAVGQPVLDLDSVLFRDGGEPVGQVFDVFGPVAQPYYVVRFNKPEDIAEKKYVKDEPVYYAPLHADMTQYVFVSELKKIKGSDASWEHNNEPPPEHLDYSDDEQEREARRRRKTTQREPGNVWRKTDNNGRSRSETDFGYRKPGSGDATPKRQYPANRGQNMAPGSRAPRPDLWNNGPTSRPNTSNGHPRPPTWRPMGNAPPFHPPLPQWLCPPPPRFGSPCRWPNGPASAEQQQRMRQLWSSPPPPIGPPQNTYPGALFSSPWSVGPQPPPPPPPAASPDSSAGCPPVWSQLYDPVPDLQRILMTPPPSLP